MKCRRRPRFYVDEDIFTQGTFVFPLLASLFTYLTTPRPAFLAPFCPSFLLFTEKNLPASTDIEIFFSPRTLFNCFSLFPFFLHLLCFGILIHLSSFGHIPSHMCSFVNSSVGFMISKLSSVNPKQGQGILKQNDPTLPSQTVI